MRKLIISIFVLTQLLAATAWSFETAWVLPKKGITRVRLVGVFTGGITDNYNSNGQLEYTTSALNQNMTLASALEGAADSKKQQVDQLVEALNTLNPGLGDLVLNSNTELSSEFQLNAQTLIPAVEYAYTSRISLGLRVPIVKRNFKIKVKAQGNDYTHIATQQVGQLSEEITEGLNTVSEGFPTTSQAYSNQFTSKGYQAPADFSDTNIGDVEFGAKWNFYNDNTTYVTTQLGIRLPTGSTGEINNLFDTGTGGGAYALGLSLFEETELFPNFTVSAMQNIKVYLPDSRDRIVPKDADDSLPDANTQVEDVERAQAPRFEAIAGARYKFMEGSFYLSTTYGLGTQAEASFSGNGDLYYEGLEKDTDKFTSFATLQFGYSSIPAFKRKELFIPFETRIQYYSTLDGRNTAQIDYIRTEVLFYF